MNNFNNVPSQGVIADMTAAINQNFTLTKEMLERLQLTKDKSKGLFADATALNASIPSPEVGDWALVGSESPFAVYTCSVAGTWADSGGEYDAGTIDLSDYATKEEVTEAATMAQAALDAVMTTKNYSFTDEGGGADGSLSHNFFFPVRGGDIVTFTPSPYNWDTSGVRTSQYVLILVPYNGTTQVATYMTDVDGDAIYYNGGSDLARRKTSYTVTVPQGQNINRLEIQFRAAVGVDVTFNVLVKTSMADEIGEITSANLVERMDDVEDRLDVMEDSTTMTVVTNHEGTGRGYTSGVWHGTWDFDVSAGEKVTIKPTPYDWDVTTGESTDHPTGAQEIFGVLVTDGVGDTPDYTAVTDDDGLVLAIKGSNRTARKSEYHITIPAGAVSMRVRFRATKNVTVNFEVTRYEPLSDVVQDLIDGGEGQPTDDIIKLNKDKADLITALKIPYKSGDDNPYAVVFALTSDIHGDTAACRRFIRLGTTYGLEMLHLGDSVNRGILDGSPWTNLEGKENVMNIIGNHDTRESSNQTYRDADLATVYSTFTAPFASRVTQPSGAASSKLNYWYKDYANAKVRLIALDCMEWGRTGTDAGRGDAEYNWFVSTLTNAGTNNLSVIIAVHYKAAPSSEMTPFGMPGLWRGFDSVNDTWVGGTAVNMKQLVGVKIINAVKDFIDNGGDFICWLSGHQHKEWHTYLNDDPRQINLILPSSRHDYATTEYGNNSEETSKYYDDITLLSVETNYHTIALARIGRDMDKRGRTAAPILINYQTKEILSEMRVSNSGGTTDQTARDAAAAAQTTANSALTTAQSKQDKGVGLLFGAYDITSSSAPTDAGTTTDTTGTIYYFGATDTFMSKVGSSYYGTFPNSADYMSSGHPIEGVSYWLNNKQYQYIGGKLRPLTFVMCTESEYTARTDKNVIAIIIEQQQS